MQDQAREYGGDRSRRRERKRGREKGVNVIHHRGNTMGRRRSGVGFGRRERKDGKEWRKRRKRRERKGGREKGVNVIHHRGNTMGRKEERQ